MKKCTEDSPTVTGYYWVKEDFSFPYIVWYAAPNKMIFNIGEEEITPLKEVRGKWSKVIKISEE